MLKTYRKVALHASGMLKVCMNHHVFTNVGTLFLITLSISLGMAWFSGLSWKRGLGWS